MRILLPGGYDFGTRSTVKRLRSMISKFEIFSANWAIEQMPAEHLAWMPKNQARILTTLRRLGDLSEAQIEQLHNANGRRELEALYNNGMVRKDGQMKSEQVENLQAHHFLRIHPDLVEELRGASDAAILQAVGTSACARANVIRLFRDHYLEHGTFFGTLTYCAQRDYRDACTTLLRDEVLVRDTPAQHRVYNPFVSHVH